MQLVYAQEGGNVRPLKLDDLEKMALQNNPTAAQAEAAIQAADGRRKQAGLWPNPIIGYSGTEFALRAFNDKSEHSLFIEQTIPLGRKLKKSQNIYAQEKLQAQENSAAQKQRIINAVRILFYRALGAQELVTVRSELAKLAKEATNVTNELFNVGQADKPDAYQIGIEAERAQLDLMIAENERDQIWQELGAVIGNPYLKPSPLDGTLEIERLDLAKLDQNATLSNLLQHSPELKIAQAGVERAKASLTRAKAEPTPDLFVRGGFGYSTELLDSAKAKPGQKTGPEGAVEVGVRIPIFNRNQGGIAEAGADVVVAEREVRRIELTLHARFAGVWRSYTNALSITTQYRNQIVPKAQSSYDMYRSNFRSMAAAYPQVLIAQRTLFQVKADYIDALVELRKSIIQLQGMLLVGGLDAPSITEPQDSGNTGGNQ